MIHSRAFLFLPLFKKARREHQPDDGLMVEEAEDMYMCCFDLPVPQKANEWKRLKRSPEGFCAYIVA